LALQAHHAQWSTLFAQGELAQANLSAQQSLTLYHARASQPLLFGGHDPAVCAYGYAALTHWLMGNEQQASDAEQASLDLAQRLDQPVSFAAALEKSALLHTLRGDLAALQVRNEALISLAREHHLAYWLALGTILRGWLLAQQAHPTDGIAQMLAGLQAYHITGTAEGRPYLLALLADAHARAGQHDEGLRVIGDALQLVNSTGERWCEAELYRLQGELLIAAGHDAAEAEGTFQRALAVAQQQGAQWFELRAALSLSQWLEKQNRPLQARELLDARLPARDRSLDSPTLNAARELLDHLSASRVA